jgi:hypothetical protein
MSPFIKTQNLDTYNNPSARDGNLFIPSPNPKSKVKLKIQMPPPDPVKLAKRVRHSVDLGSIFRPRKPSLIPSIANIPDIQDDCVVLDILPTLEAQIASSEKNVLISKKRKRSIIFKSMGGNFQDEILRVAVESKEGGYCDKKRRKIEDKKNLGVKPKR